MMDKEFLLEELIKQLAQRNKPFESSREKASFCKQFYVFLKEKKQYDQTSNQHISHFFTSLETGIRPQCIKTEKQFRIYSKLQQIYSNTSTNNMANMKWKFALMRLWKQKPHYMNTNRRMESSEKEEMLTLMRKNGYAGKSNYHFTEDRKCLIRTLRRYKRMRLAKTKQEIDLFNYLKAKLKEIDAAYDVKQDEDMDSSQTSLLADTSTQEHAAEQREQAKWKVALMKLWKEKPHLMNSKVGQEEKEGMLEVMKKNGYGDDDSEFWLDRKLLLYGLRKSNCMRFLKTQEEKSLFQELKELAVEPANRDETIDDEFGEDSLEFVVETKPKIENKTPMSNKPKIDDLEGIEETRCRRSTRQRTLRTLTNTSLKRDFKRFDSDIENERRPKKIELPTPKENMTFCRDRDVSGYIDDAAPILDYKEESQQPQDPLVQKWEHRVDPIPSDGLYKKIFQKFGKMANKRMEFANEIYTIGIPIGYGGFSVVHKGLSSVRGAVALKFAIKEEIEALSNQLKAKNNPFIVNILNSHPIDGGSLYVLPLFDCDLYQLAFQESQGVLFSHLQVLQLASQVSSALAEIHSLNFFHADVKPENILLKDVEVKNVDGKKTLTRVSAALVDFNICLSKGDYDQPVRRLIQTHNYRAPEVIAGAPSNSKVDSWSLGMVILHLLFDGSAFNYEAYKGTKEAAQYLLKLSNDIFEIEPQEIKNGDEAILTKYSALKANNQFMGITLKERFESLPRTAVVSILVKIIKDSMRINIRDRASISEIYNYIRDFAL